MSQLIYEQSRVPTLILFTRHHDGNSSSLLKTKKEKKKKKQEYSKGRDKTIPTADSMIIYTENSKGLQKEGGKNFLELISEFSMISRYKYKIKCISIY